MHHIPRVYHVQPYTKNVSTFPFDMQLGSLAWATWRWDREISNLKVRVQFLPLNVAALNYQIKAMPSPAACFMRWPSRWPWEACKQGTWARAATTVVQILLGYITDLYYGIITLSFLMITNVEWAFWGCWLTCLKLLTSAVFCKPLPRIETKNLPLTQQLRRQLDIFRWPRLLQPCPNELFKKEFHHWLRFKTIFCRTSRQCQPAQIFPTKALEF